MKLFKLVIANMLVTTAVMVGAAGTVNAMEVNDPNCEVYNRYPTAQNFVVNEGKRTVTVHFNVVKRDANGPDCKKEVTVTAWNAPNGVDGVPLNAQTLHDHKSGKYAVGYHAVTLKLPKCFYQIDLVRGLSPYGQNPAGGADYAGWQFVSAIHGGKECKPVPPTPTPTPDPVTPTPVTPVKALPNTGPASVVAMTLGTGGLAGLAHNIRARRRLNK